MSDEAKLLCGVVLIAIPSIEYGGYFLLRVLSGNFQELELNGFQKAMFRAGHAHAGVIVILSMICILMTDHANLSAGLKWLVRSGVPSSALLISGGFFFSAIGKGAIRPNKWIGLIYTGTIVLAISLIILGVGLLRG